MRGFLLGGLLLALAGCGEQAATPGAETIVEAPEATEPAPKAGSCDSIKALAAAMSEPEPFASLRTGKEKLDGVEIADSFTTNANPAGAACKIGVMDGFDPGGGKLHVVNCTVFASGMLDREANAVKAKEAFDAAREELEACLPTDWKARDGAQAEADATEAMIYETAADAQRAMTASFYAYPVELKKEWSEAMKSGIAPGWQVTLNFQKEAAR